MPYGDTEERHENYQVIVAAVMTLGALLRTGHEDRILNTRTFRILVAKLLRKRLLQAL